MFTEFVGGFGGYGLPTQARENSRDGILPTKHGQLSGGWNRFWLGSAGAVIQRIGLGVISVMFLSRAVAFHATTLNRNKDLQDDKEGCATCVVGKHGSHVV